MLDKLDSDQKVITVSYNTFQELIDREDIMKTKLEKDLEYKDEFVITDNYISVDEDKYYLNFIITPKYRA